MYFCIVLISVSAALSFLFLMLGKALSKKSIYDRELQSPFECGFSTYNDFRVKFSLHFFLVALVFIIFDVELIVLFPYFSCMNVVSSFFSSMVFMVLLLLLTLGLFNEWNQVILEWMK